MNVLVGAHDYRDYLRFELDARQSRRPKYSLRAFSRDLKMSPSHLSDVLSGRERLSIQAAQVVSKELGFNPIKKSHFIGMVALEKALKAEEQAKIRAKLEKIVQDDSSYHEHDLDHFKMISDWHHLGILAAAELKSIGGDVQKTAKSLGIDGITVREAVRRLSRLGLIKIKDRAIEVLKSKTMTPRNEVPSYSVRRFHRQMLQKAGEALDLFAVSERFASSSLIAVATEDIPAAKEFLIEMRNKFIERFENKDKADEIIGLTLAMFPVTQKQEGKKS
jgi:uncharacterized protein (TIGR02147 family)